MTSPLRRAGLLLFAGALAGSLSGCVLDRTGQSATEQYKRQMKLQGARIDNLEQQVDQIDGKLAQIDELTQHRGQQDVMQMETLEQVRGEVNRLRGAYEELKFSTDRTTAEEQKVLEDAAFRIEWLDARAAQLEKNLGLKAPAPPARGSGPADSGGGAAAVTEKPAEGPSGGAAAAEGATEVKDPVELMKLATDHLKAGRNAAAEAVLNRFLSLHPNHEKAPEARYRLGEAAFNEKNYPQAVLRFQVVIDKHKKSKWAPWAMLRQGESFDAQGQKDNAKLFYEEVDRLWSDSPAAKEAREKLKKRK